MVSSVRRRKQRPQSARRLRQQSRETASSRESCESGGGNHEILEGHERITARCSRTISSAARLRARTNFIPPYESSCAHSYGPGIRRLATARRIGIVFRGAFRAGNRRPDIAATFFARRKFMRANDAAAWSSPAADPVGSEQFSRDLLFLADRSVASGHGVELCAKQQIVLSFRLIGPLGVAMTFLHDRSVRIPERGKHCHRQQPNRVTNFEHDGPLFRFPI